MQDHERLQEIMQVIQAKLPVYGVRLNWPDYTGGKVYLTAKGVMVSPTEQWASSLYVERAQEELSEKQFDKLVREMEDNLLNVEAGIFTEDEKSHNPYWTE